MSKKRTLKKELTMLMMLVSACTLISACAAVLYVFFSFFIENTQEDIEYVLNSTSQQFQSHMQFIEDGAVSIRHNMMLNDFFDTGKSGADYDRTVTEPQLSYSMELFSDRNMINKKIPFVTSVYLFNNAGDCIYEHYYASTLAAEKKEETQYLSMQRQFQQSQDRYACVSDDKSINLLFRIYDDHMEEKGICIAKISREAVNVLLGEGIAYSDCTWMVLFGDDRIIAFQGRWSEIEQLTQLERVWRGKRLLKEHNVIGCAKMCGFDIRTVICVGEENIFSVLKSTVLIFVVGLIIVLIVTVLVAFGLSYRFTRPVTRMIEKIQAFGKQDFDDRMEDSTIQEYHDIGVVFNEMAERIKYLIMQVYEKQLLATQSQVKYLQAQTNPHFQFNILSMLSLKAKMAGNEEVYEGLKAFSKLMQGKIFREKEIKIKVSEELEIVRFYLYLQKSRYQDKICYEIKVQDDRINQNLIPRLLIEPLVENAVSHGLEPKRGNGIIKIILYEEPGIYDGSMMLHICVEDDGVGFDPEKMVENGGEKELLDGKIEHTHTGLENTKRMLTILYGSFHEFRISGGIGRGTKVEIVIPSERGGDMMWKVIAADDEGYIREALQKLIDWRKMNCVLEAVVCDGQALIDQIREGHPDIVISDIQMPGMDGVEVCRFVYETCPGTQVILLTAYSEFEYARAAIKYNACDYVLKISIIEELPRAVEKAAKELEKCRSEDIQKDQGEKKEPGTLYLQMERYIEQNFQTKLSLEEIAEALHANGSYLSRLYKNKTGKNLFDAILDRRIEAAKEYLLFTDMKTYEISEAVGIEDSGYFSKMFKKKIGVSPKEYRKGGNHGEIQ